jgi:hypothetical protein
MSGAVTPSWRAKGEFHLFVVDPGPMPEDSDIQPLKLRV